MARSVTRRPCPLLVRRAFGEAQLRCCVAAANAEPLTSTRATRLNPTLGEMEGDCPGGATSSASRINLSRPGLGLAISPGLRDRTNPPRSPLLFSKLESPARPTAKRNRRARLRVCTRAISLPCKPLRSPFPRRRAPRRREDGTRRAQPSGITHSLRTNNAAGGDGIR